uniref:LigA n=1 Tax=Parastrongyloides trichosuri TaxID=131310 RepID=A0A0N5A5T1_PARTI
MREQVSEALMKAEDIDAERGVIEGADRLAGARPASVEPSADRRSQHHPQRPARALRRVLRSLLPPRTRHHDRGRRLRRRSDGSQDQGDLLGLDAQGRRRSRARFGTGRPAPARDPHPGGAGRAVLGPAELDSQPRPRSRHGRSAPRRPAAEPGHGRAEPAPGRTGPRRQPALHRRGRRPGDSVQDSGPRQRLGRLQPRRHPARAGNHRAGTAPPGAVRRFSSRTRSRDRQHPHGAGKRRSGGRDAQHPGPGQRPAGRRQRRQGLLGPVRQPRPVRGRSEGSQGRAGQRRAEAGRGSGPGVRPDRHRHGRRRQGGGRGRLGRLDLRRPARPRPSRPADGRFGSASLPGADAPADPPDPRRSGRAGTGLYRLADHRCGQRSHRVAPGRHPGRGAEAARNGRNPREAGPGVFARRPFLGVRRVQELRLHLDHGGHGSGQIRRLLHRRRRHHRRPARQAGQRGRAEPRAPAGDRGPAPQPGRQRILAGPAGGSGRQARLPGADPDAHQRPGILHRRRHPGGRASVSEAGYGVEGRGRLGQRRAVTKKGPRSARNGAQSLRASCSAPSRRRRSDAAANARCTDAPAVQDGTPDARPRRATGRRPCCRPRSRPVRLRLLGREAQRLDLPLFQFPDHLAGLAHDQAVVGNDLALGDQGVGADQAVLPDARAIEDDRADADQAVVADRAAMQHHLVAHRHASADGQGGADVSMQDAAILNIRVRPDDDGIIIATQHGVEPDAGARMQNHTVDAIRQAPFAPGSEAGSSPVRSDAGECAWRVHDQFGDGDAPAAAKTLRPFGTAARLRPPPPPPTTKARPCRARLFSCPGGVHEQTIGHQASAARRRAGFARIHSGRQGAAIARPRRRLVAPALERRAGPGLSQDAEAQVRRPGRTDGGRRPRQSGPGPGPGRHRQDLPGRGQGGRGAGGGQGRPHRPEPPCGRGRGIDRIPARRHGGQTGPLSAAALRRPFGSAVDEAGQGPDGRGPDRDRSHRLYARPHPEQRLHRRGRGAELHLRPAEDAADPAGLALDHGGDGRPAAIRPAAGRIGPVRHRGATGGRARNRGRPPGRTRHRASPAGGQHDRGAVTLALLW